MSKNEQLDVQDIEDVINDLAKKAEVSDIAVALHNTLCYGDLFKIHAKNNKKKGPSYGKNDCLLGEVIASAENLWNACRKMERKKVR